VTRDEAQRYFDEHRPEFTQPLRLRARHIFLAAPAGSEKVETQRAAMEQIVARLQRGEDFASLAAAVSEDEASKSRGGDLGFVASNRVPAEFWSAIETLPVNGPVALVQSHLGFHAVQVLEARPPRLMSLEEARPEIEEAVAGEKRQAAVNRVREQLARQAVLGSR
jgi:parvulin-like peptidyl-prolyl isomerase